jgi:two-component system response regulator AtoC
MTSRGSVLIVDDDNDIAMLLCDGLRRRGFSAETASSAHACLERVRVGAFDVVVTDVQMPGTSGVELCAVLHDRHPDLLPIVFTGAGDLEIAVAAIRAGAFDFITKPVKCDVLAAAIQRALDHLAVKHDVTRLAATADPSAPIAGITGTSSVVRDMLAMVRQVAASDAAVLITGESGTGKELVAHAVHDLSSRRAEPFVAINCAAIPPTLLESELFGHVRGAFTDGRTARQGLFVRAGRGTIFLDEIGEMRLDMQVKLLRALQARTVRPVGSDQEVPFEARVVTATNRNLEAAVENRTFRKDLYYRINVLSIQVPSLRARAGDIVAIAEQVLARIALRSGKRPIGLGPEAVRKLVDYEWPGNIRELENCLERAMAVSNGPAIGLPDLPLKVRHHLCKRAALATTGVEMVSLDEMDHRYVTAVLHSVQGNKTAAARILGIARRSVYRILRPQETPVLDLPA